MAVQVFEIPSSGGSFWLSVIMAFPVALCLVLAAVFWPRHLSLEVTPAQVTIRGSVYGRSIAMGELELDQVKVIDLEKTPEFWLQSRSNGVGLPRYHVGWFHLNNGQRALCFLTSSQPVIYLPTKSRFVLLVSVARPTELLAALRSAKTGIPSLGPG